MPRARSTALAVVALLALYGGLSLLNDPHGSLGTDTGAKVLTLRAMRDRHTAVPDVGYWAERWDPTGRVHPLHDVAYLHGHWVIVTTLPMLLAAAPLYRLGGYRLALLLPMLGAIAAALAARALARRLGSSPSGAWMAFWMIGLASPLALYALDFWEHAPGLAAMAWAVVFLLDGGPRRALAAGVLFGFAATMRTEALVYGAVAVAVSCGAALLWERRWRDAIMRGVAAAFGVAAMIGANTLLERWVIGASLRAGRATATAATASGSSATNRLDEAGQTALSFGAPGARAALVGAMLLALLVYVARRRGGPAPIAAVTIGALYAFRFVDGFGFVPGLLPATPAAGLGMATFDRRNRHAVVIGMIAVLALPLVWAFQYTGGAGPQWAGRYILLSGFLLAVMGFANFERVPAAGRIVAIAAPVVVTVFGLAWMSIRTHDVARATGRLNARPETVLISREAFFVREGGAYFGTERDRRWLTAPTNADLAVAARVLRDSGAPTAAVVDVTRPGSSVAPQLDGYAPTGTQHLRLFSDTSFTITSFRAL